MKTPGEVNLAAQEEIKRLKKLNIQFATALIMVEMGLPEDLMSDQFGEFSMDIKKAVRKAKSLYQI